MQTRAKTEGKKEKSLERKSCKSNPSSWSRAHRKGGQRSSHSKSFFLACHPSPAPAQQERAQSCEAGKDGKAGKSKGFSQRDEISMEGVSPPQAVTHRWTPARQQLTQGAVILWVRWNRGRGIKRHHLQTKSNFFYSL